MKLSLWTPLLVVPLGCSTGPDLPAAQPNKIVGAYVAQCAHGASEPFELGPQDGALIPDPSLRAGFQFRPATSKTDGTFEIDNVPDGTRYFLQIGGQLFDTDQRVIDANFDTRVRCAPFANDATVAVPVTFALTRMTPYAAGDTITAASFALNNAQDSTIGANPGDTSITSELDWLGAMPDASLGDDLTILHTHADPLTSDGRSSSHLVDAFTSHQVTLQAQVPTTVSGRFAPAPVGSMKIDLDASAYVTPYGAVSDSFNWFDIRIAASPDATDVTQGPTLGELQRPLGDLTKPTLIEQVAFGDPFPASWTRSITISSQVDRAYKVAPTQTIGLPLGATQTVTFAGADAPKFAPMLLPPTGLLINGVDGTVAHEFQADIVGPVTVAWQPVEGATNYQIEIWHFVNDANGLNIPPASGVTTAATQVVLPGTLFTGDGFYVLMISAQDHLPDLAGGHLFANLDHLRSATIASGRLRFSSTCGNGVVDAGEDCDDKGESATCNADCTVATCRDGVLNTTAGEQCDTIFDTATCIAASCKTR